VSSFGPEALHAEAVGGAGSRELERRLLVIETVGALGAIDRAHPAATEDADEAPRTQMRAEPRIGGRRQAVDDEAFEVECGALVRRKHRLELGPQRVIAGADVGEKGVSRRRRA
jgi:hypothetical protein